jgi:indole-3-glycerol phosphate synthase
MNILSRILDHKKEEVAGRKRRTDHARLEDEARSARAAVSLAGALHPLAVIAEIKKASPSAGVLRKTFDPPAHALAYERAGAAAISVLTDERFFQGSLEDLRQVKSVTTLPVLRKDFIIDRFQLLEARAAGADAVLLIAAALPRDRLGELHADATALGLESLVEVHSEDEVAALDGLRARIIGINNRDLETFLTDLSTSVRLRPLTPVGAAVVSESGIRTGADLLMLRESGIDAVLIGEHCMRAPDPGAALSELLADYAQLKSSRTEKLHR